MPLSLTIPSSKIPKTQVCPSKKLQLSIENWKIVEMVALVKFRMGIGEQGYRKFEQGNKCLVKDRSVYKGDNDGPGSNTREQLARS